MPTAVQFNNNKDVKDMYEQHPYWLTFTNAKSEATYCHWAYVTSGFYGGKLWQFLSFGIAFLFFIWYRPALFSKSMFYDEWAPIVYYFFLGWICFTCYMLPNLVKYREIVFTVSLIFHWPCWVVTNFHGKDPHTHQYLSTLLCVFFCMFVPQVRFCRTFPVIACAIVGTLFCCTFPFAYWENHSRFELIYWVLYIIPFWLLRSFEITSRDSYRAVQVSEARLTLMEQKIASTEQVVVNLFPPTPTLGLISDQIEQSFSDAVMIVTDVAGFTKWVSSTPPMVVLNFISDMFAKMDNISMEHGVEKVSTVGDCFMGVIFAPQSATSTYSGGVADRCLHGCQWCMQSIRSCCTIKGLLIRIGIHVGDVRGGFIGRSPLKYDLFGPEFGIAKRMESEGTPGMLHLSFAVVRELERKGLPTHGVVRESSLGIVIDPDLNDFSLIGTSIEDFVDPEEFDRGFELRGRESEICEQICSLSERSVVGNIDLPSPRKSLQSLHEGSMAIIDDDQLQFNRIFLFFPHKEVERKYQTHLSNVDLMSFSQRLMLVMQAVIFVGHFAVGCVDGDQNRGITAAIFVLLVAATILNVTARLSRSHTHIVFIAIFNAIFFASQFYEANCTTTDRPEFYTSNTAGLYFNSAIVVSQFYLKSRILTRVLLACVTTGLWFAGVGIRRATMKDEVHLWELIFLLGPPAAAFISYFIDYSLRSAFVANTKVKNALRSARGQQEELAGKAMGVMLPTFVIERLIEERQKRQFHSAEDFSDTCSVTEDVDLRDVVGDGFLWEFPSIAVMFVLITSDKGDLAIPDTDDVICHIEAVASTFGCMKVKSIGQVVLLVNGLTPEDRDNNQHLIQTAKAARAVVKKVFTASRKAKGMDVQIGINCGPLFGTVLGHSGLMFDVFGDTVNVASRMESTAAPGTIQCTAPVGQALEEVGVPVQSMPPVAVKGKGNLDVYRIPTEHIAGNELQGSWSVSTFAQSMADISPQSLRYSPGNAPLSASNKNTEGAHPNMVNVPSLGSLEPIVQDPKQEDKLSGSGNKH